MIVLGVVLLVLGYVLPVPLLMTLGWVALVVGIVLLVLGAGGQPIGGRRYWW